MRVTSEGRDLLSSLDGPLVVIGVVGTTRTGKSFLMNQLIGSDAQSQAQKFEVGNSVKAKTKGIWGWLTKREGSLEYPVLLLDSEGFFGENISEVHDAKIFAVSTLLSSQLIYNTFRHISQADVDFLHQLARRAKLFQIKAEKRQEEEALENAPEFHFPGLHWVIRDFIMNLEGESSCTEWLLNRIESTQDPTFSEYERKVSLATLFTSVKCHTLFLPVRDTSLLLDLSSKAVEQEQLSPSFLRYLEEMKQDIFRDADNAFRTQGPGVYSSGGSLLAILNLLVHYANTQNFPTIPSMWNTFLQIQQNTCVEEAVDQFRNTMDREVEKAESTHEIQSMKDKLKSPRHQKALIESERSRAWRYINATLFGLTDRFKYAAEKFDKQVGRMTNEYILRFERAIEKAIESYSRDVLEHEEKGTRIAGEVVTSRELGKRQSASVSDAKKKFESTWAFLDDANKVRSAWFNLHKQIQGVQSIEFQKNIQDIKSRLENLGTHSCQTVSKHVDIHVQDLAVPAQSFEKIINGASNYKDEDFYHKIRDATNFSFQQLRSNLMEENNSDCYTICLNLKDTDKIQQLLNSTFENLTKAFKTELSPLYSELPLEISQEALQNAKRRILRAKKDYYFVSSFYQQAISILEGELSNLIKSQKLKRRVAEEFVERELKNEILSLEWWLWSLPTIATLGLSYLYVLFSSYASILTLLNLLFRENLHQFSPSSNQLDSMNWDAPGKGARWNRWLKLVENHVTQWIAISENLTSEWKGDNQGGVIFTDGTLREGIAGSGYITVHGEEVTIGKIARQTGDQQRRITSN
ncbi:guanylate-binding protein [Planoprotostelium fungivorum]|uniref:Guanylate-binding protein n=1 Tax=Planoprotostelium fungivorum TaxID=1890364 RepID=A0A2P6N728_9EUKA|nr:guanylate-binding protein [Planoprotostelium fungivorum]